MPATVSPKSPSKRTSAKRPDPKQIPLFESEVVPLSFGGAHATFQLNKEAPIHRWYPYLEGYGPGFVANIASTYLPTAKHILDPFVGSGTTPLVLSSLGITSSYCEANPILRDVTRIKLAVASLPESQRIELSTKLAALARSLPERVKKAKNDAALQKTYLLCFDESVFFTPDAYDDVLRLRSVVDDIHETDAILADLLTLSIFSKLVICSCLKRAGDVRYKTEKELANTPASIVRELQTQLELMGRDCLGFHTHKAAGTLICNDARMADTVPSVHADGVITSPPYINGTNYIRNTKLELWFQRELTSSADLRKFRDTVVTSGINDVAGKQNYLPVTDSISKVLESLKRDAYDQRIPQMVAAYFSDMLRVFRGLHHHTNPNAVVCIDIGDSQYGGVHVPTHSLLPDVARLAGFNLETSVTLRKRQSKDGTPLTQELLVFKKGRFEPVQTKHHQVAGNSWKTSWEHFKADMPHQQAPFTARNWGCPLHSLCSYSGKLKPSLAYHLVNTFTKPGQSILDPFSGAATIPFEAALNGRKAFALDISDLSYAITRAKLSSPDRKKVDRRIEALQKWIVENPPTEADIKAAAAVQFNKPVPDYFHEKTLAEILSARRFFKETRDESPEWALLMSSTLHILHGNRPYALSRRSHPITPFAPTGEFIYKSLIEKLREKAYRSLEEERPTSFVDGQCFQTDALAKWPAAVKNIDAVITSPPFFDSTRFYMANWMRFWFCGWERADFDKEPAHYLEQLQKSSLNIYQQLFEQAKDRLTPKGLVVLHLGISKKCDMGKELAKIGEKFFEILDLYNEDVQHCEKHGMRDKGTVTGHQYLVMGNRP
jgi:DNA modification methylase